jgi:hypothetical protein
MYGDKDKNPIIDTGNFDYKNLCNIYTTVFRVKRLNNRTRSMGLFNGLTRKSVV